MSAVKKTILGIFVSLLVVGIASMLFVVSKNNQKIYPTKISVQGVPREIELVLGNYLLFDTKPYIVSPTNSTADVEVSVTDYNSKSTSKASFTNLTFTATDVGNYYIRIKTQNKYGKILQDAIKIKVVKPVNATTEYVKVLTEYAKTETYTPVHLNKMATSGMTSNIQFFENGQPLSSSYVYDEVGHHNITACILENGYKKCADFSIVVKPPQDYSLFVYDTQGHTLLESTEQTIQLSQEIVMFTYQTNNEDDQKVDIKCDNNCVEIESCDAPIVSCKLLKRGKCTLTFSYRNITQHYVIIVV